MIKRIQKFFIISIRRGTFYVTNVTKKCTHVTYHDNILIRIQWSFTSARKRLGTSGLSSVTDVAKLPLTGGFPPSFLIHTRDVYVENTSQRRRYTQPIAPNGTASSLHFRNSADTLTSKLCGLPRAKRQDSNFEMSKSSFPSTHSFQLIIPSETKRNLLKDSVRTAL